MNTKTAAIVLHAMLLPVLGLAFAIIGMTHTAPVGDWVGTDTATAEKPHNVPAWTADTAAAFPGCTGEVGLGAQAVVVTQQGETVRMDWDRAWTLSTDAEHANDLWVIGTCQ